MQPSLSEEDGGHNHDMSTVDDADKWRDLVISSVNEILSDISKVKNTELHSDLITGLEFILNAANRFPEIFFPPLLAHSDDQENDANEEWQKMLKTTPYELTCWIIRHLLRIISVRGFNVVQEKAESLILALLRTANVFNRFCFASLSSELISALEDLDGHFVNFFSGNEDVTSSVVLNRFSSSRPNGRPLDSTLKLGNIDIQDSEICQQLSISITKVVSDLTLCLSCYENLVARTWKVTNSQLENGDVDLKTASLRLSVRLLSFEVPQLCALECYSDCLVALAKLLCTMSTECEGDLDALEIALADALSRLMDGVNRTTVLTSDRLIVLRFVHLHFLNLLTLHGTGVLRTLQLRSAVCESLSCCMRCLPSSVVSFAALKDTYKDGLCRRLLTDIGSTADSQYMVSLLRQVIFLELVQFFSGKISIENNVIKETATEMDNDKEDAMDVEGLANDKTLASQLNASVAMTDVSAVASFLADHLSQISASLSQYNGEDLVEALQFVQTQRTLLETLATSFMIYLHLWQESRSDQRSKEIVQMLHLEQLKNVLTSWLDFLSRYSSRQSHELMLAYDAIVKSVGAIVYAQGFDALNLEIVNTLMGILSLPWLSSEFSYFDLKIADTKQLSMISEQLWDKIDGELVAECIRIISLTPRSCAPKWRIRVFLKAFGDTRDSVRAAAISSVPFLLHNLGNSSHYILLEIIRGCLLDTSSMVAETLASCIGQIACVISGRTKMIRNPLAKDDGLCYRTVKLSCGLCVKISKDGKSKQIENKIAVTATKIDASVFRELQKLLSSDNRSVKLNLIGCFDKLFRHLWNWQINSLSLEWLTSALTLLQDPDYDVQLALSKVVRYLFVCNDDSALSNVSEIIMLKLNEFEKLLAMNPPSLHLMEVKLIIISEIGRAAEGELLLKTVIILFNVIIFPVLSSLERVALLKLKLVAKQKNLTLISLFLQFGHQICQAFADRLHETKEKKPEWDPSEVLQKVADVFGFTDVQTFLKRTEHLLLPHLVRKASPTSSILLKCISRLMDDPNHKNAIIRAITQIFCHIICSIDQQSELSKVLKYLEDETDWSLSKLLACGTNLESILLVHLSSNYQQVLHGMTICLTEKGILHSSVDISMEKQLAEILKPMLLGYIVHLDKLLNDSTVPLNEKRTAYKSLTRLMELIGSQHITQVRMRVITTLKLGLKFKDCIFTELCCEAWSTFVHLLELTALGPMLCQIVVSLLPLLQLLPSKVAVILHYLIVENREGLHKHLHELYFLPDIPELSQINAVLKEYLEGQYSCNDLRTQIENMLKGITNEALDVRQMALTRMKRLLRKNKDVLHGMIMGDETVDPIISRIVSTLIQGCRESDPGVRNLIGECLGELGAIDPGRLEFASGQMKTDPTRIFLSVMDEGFAFDLINELAKAFLRAEDRTAQDCVAFALQEMIQIYKIEAEGKSGSTGAKLWRQFSSEVQEILLPLTQSRYRLNIALIWSGLPWPIYRSRRGSTFENWVCSLTGYLESKVTEKQCKMVFEVCRGVINQDKFIALYLLPYLILQVLIEGNTEDQSMLLLEFNAVLLDVKEDEARYGSPSDLRHMSAQTIFSVLDYLSRWIRHYSMVTLSSKPEMDKTQPKPEESRLTELKNFLTKVPQDVLSLASYNCGAVTRSMMHHEHFMRSSGRVNCRQENLDFLLKLYLTLDEPDGVAGIIATQQNPLSLAQQILSFESVGQLSDASVCYDLAIRLDPTDVTYRQGLLKNKLAVGEISSALDLANGMVTENASWSSQLNVYRVEAAWKLGQWDKMETYLKAEDCSRDWNIGLGKVLLAAKSKDEKSLSSCLLRLRQEQMAPLSAASMEIGAYHRGYEYIARLHMLKELEDGLRIALRLTPLHHDSFGRDSSALNDLPDEVTELSTMIRCWQGRVEFTQASYRTRSPILDLQRVILTLAKDERGFETNEEIGNCWLQSARMARKCGLIQTAHSLLMCAADYKLQDFCIEKAKWMWDKGDCDQARLYLEKTVERLYPDRARFKTPGSEVNVADRLACAKALLQLSRYNEETCSCESNTIVKQFKEVKDIHKEWEDGYFYTAKYYDKIMTTLIDNDRHDKRGEFITQVINHFGQSLCYGNRYIYQSMPRMLTLWLDFGAEVVSGDDRPETTKQSMKSTLSQMNKLMQDFCRRLSPSQFLVSFPQLISRICHAHPDVFAQLREMIANLLKEFPQQAMWMMMAVSKSSYQMRVKRCQEIFGRARGLRPDLVKFLQDATKLADLLLDLCNKPVEGFVTSLSISQHFKALQRLLEDPEMSSIILPLQSQMLPILQRMPVVPSSSSVSFSANQIFIRGIEDGVEVLASLQKPKKITFRGSDGKLYIMLCKPRDDLRKDARLMEFTNLVNRCLKKDADSRRRDLHIRTFTVTPLNEECGLLEWVSNVHGLRPILLKLYREKGVYMSGKELKTLQLPPNAPLNKKLQIYKTKLLPRHPACFSEWFLRSFSDPTSWYCARLAYCRTAAVMSVVGYILGLGDRHGENILIDSTVGDCLHVDFNCLFNKGETFDYPEIVPFRLTHNMIEAMGPLGYEGIFRKSCEVTLRVMKDQRDPLMSVLKTFIYDPLVEWSKPIRGRANPTESGEIRNEKAQTHVNNIEDRLRGILKNKAKPLGLPLSVEGHVSHLIKESTDENNLCQMYIGWAAYL